MYIHSKQICIYYTLNNIKMLLRFRRHGQKYQRNQVDYDLNRVYKRQPLYYMTGKLYWKDPLNKTLCEQ